MFLPISIIDDFLKSYKENNPKEDTKNLPKILSETAKSKKDGAVCNQCGQPIWAIGTAIVGWDGCFTCISGEADNSEDYEIEGVCF
ncbi:MAG: hypothetical protein LBP36_02355 [Oscillospiraceae bacterium]|jgi:hypothetical protein|nr:hypothetical protein [Oscillospiraceae bacterium]